MTNLGLGYSYAAGEEPYTDEYDYFKEQVHLQKLGILIHIIILLIMSYFKEVVLHICGLMKVLN